MVKIYFLINKCNDNSLNGLANLQWLYLYDNEISEINENAFNGLNSLLELKLDNNEMNPLNKELLEQKIKKSFPQCQISLSLQKMPMPRQFIIGIKKVKTEY